MKNFVETSAKTVDDAVRKALEELGVAEDEVTVEVLEEESGGFLGIGAKAKVRVSLKPDEEEAYDVSDEAEADDETEEADFAETDDDEPAEDEENEEAEEAVSEDGEEDGGDDAAEASDEDEAENKLELVSDTIEKFLNDILVCFNLEGVNHVKMDEEDGRILADIDGDDCGILIGRKGETLHSLQYLTSLVANKTGKSRMRVTLDIGGYKAKRENSVASLALRTAQRAVRTNQAYELTPMSAAERRVVHETLQDFKGVTTYSEGDEPNRYVVIDLVFDDDDDYEEE